MRNLNNLKYILFPSFTLSEMSPIKPDTLGTAMTGVKRRFIFSRTVFMKMSANMIESDLCISFSWKYDECCDRLFASTWQINRMKSFFFSRVVERDFRIAAIKMQIQCHLVLFTLRRTGFNNIQYLGSEFLWICFRMSLQFF